MPWASTATQMIRRRLQRRRIRRLLFLIGVFLIGIFGITLFFGREKPKPVNVLALSIQKVLVGKEGTYGVVVRNYTTGESYALNDSKIFATGSLYKLWVMALVMEEIEKGKIHGDEILSEDVTNLNNQFHIPDENADLTEGAVTLSVKDALTQMITISHNYAALLLTQRVGEEALRKFLNDNNLTHSHIGGDNAVPVATPQDIALFFDKLYKGELGNKTTTDAMLALLKQQALNEKLPKYLPSTVHIAHKTGELDLFSHDAGIVYMQQGPYVIVVMTKTKNPATANETIAQLSKTVYEHFLHEDIKPKTHQ